MSIDRSVQLSRLLLQGVVACALCLALADICIVDKWSVSGELKDAKTGQPLRDAWVVADFKGREPLIVLPAPIHPRSRIGACMGTRITKTDQDGRFRFSVLTKNRALAEKSAFIMGFEAGYLTGTKSVAIGSSLLGTGPRVVLQLERGPGPTQFTTRYSDGDPAKTLPRVEQGYREEVFSTLRVLANDLCQPDVGAPMDIAALEHALSIAATFDERERTRAWCRSNEDTLMGFLRMAGPTTPFDCNDLPFKHQPSPDVLAVEAELAAKRKAAAEHGSSHGTSNTTSNSLQ